MNGQFYVALLNPLIGFLLAGAFLLLWSYQKSRRYVAVLALGYAVSGLGFAIADVIPTALLSEVPRRIASNACYLLAACTLSAAVFSRYRRRIPYVLLAVAGVGGMATMCWFLFVHPSLPNRIYTISVAVAAITILVVLELRKVPNKTPVDRILFAIFVITAANYMLRPIIVLWLGGPYNNYDGFQQSIYWSTVQVSHAIISIALALTLIVAAALDLLIEFKTDSHTDVLSGLLNRRGFEEKALAIIRDCRDRGEPVSLTIADLDHFKRINDSFGHAAGDEVIATFAGLLRAGVDRHAAVGRLGGEEFAIVLGGTSPEETLLIAKSIRWRLAKLATGDTRPWMRFTASFGICGMTPGDGLSDLLQRADEALYDAKQSGRDRICLFTPGPDPGAPGPGDRRSARRAA